MPNAYYFRQQAHMCARLALVTSDQGMAERFAVMAHEYLARAEAAEQAQATGVSSTDGSAGEPRIE